MNNSDKDTKLDRAPAVMSAAKRPRGKHVTAKSLYLELEQHPGAIYIIDDCERVQGQPDPTGCNEEGTLILLRSALGEEGDL
jgi:hypothetical protein